MNHQDASRLLSDFVDKTLPPGQMAEVEAHLQECQACREEVGGLRNLIRRAAALPTDIEPERDMWPDIVSAIRRSPKASERQAQRDRSRRHHREPGGIFSGIERWTQSLWSRRGLWPTSSAAAVVLAGLVLVVVLTRDTGGPTPTVSAEGTARQQPRLRVQAGAQQEAPHPTAQAVIQALETECRQADREMQHYAARAEEQHAVPILEHIAVELRSINRAITEVREAWTSDPESPQLARLLAGFYRAKAALQGRATRVAAEA